MNLSRRGPSQYVVVNSAEVCHIVIACCNIYAISRKTIGNLRIETLVQPALPHLSEPDPWLGLLPKKFCILLLKQGPKLETVYEIEKCTMTLMWAHLPISLTKVTSDIDLNLIACKTVTRLFCEMNYSYCLMNFCPVADGQTGRRKVIHEPTVP